jgi:hypothetical protein
VAEFKFGLQQALGGWSFLLRAAAGGPAPQGLLDLARAAGAGGHSGGRIFCVRPV